MGDDLGIRVQIKKTARKFGSCCVVICLCKYPNGAAESYLHVRRLQLTMREVGCKLQATANVVRIFLRYAATLQLDRDTEQILASHCN